MRILALILAATLLFCGCSSTYTIAFEQTAGSRGSRSYEQFNETMAGGSATVILRSGREFCAREIQAGKDSTRLVDECKGELRQLATREIRYIQRTDRWGGVLEGLMFGTFGVGLAAYAYGSATFDEGDQRELGVGILTVSGAAIGGVAGIVLGVISGHRYRYEFVQDPGMTSTGESDVNPVRGRVLDSNDQDVPRSTTKEESQ